MVETRFAELDGKQLQYGGHTWELTGDGELRGSGEQLSLRARQVDGVSHDDASLVFDVEDGPASPNPGNLGTALASLERDGDGQYLLVEIEPRTYRYELARMTYV